MELTLFSLLDAVLIFAVPTGVGYCLCSWGFPKTHRPVVHFLILGLTILANFFIILELFKVSLDDVRLLQRLALIIGTLGSVVLLVRSLFTFLKSGHSKRWRRDTILVGLLFPVLLIAVVVAEKFAVHQEFPALNVFQISHLIEGAVHFGDRFVLNRLIADSYIPVFQVVHGIVRSFTGGSVLEAWWLSGFLIAVVTGWFVYQLSMRLSGNLFFSVSQAVFFPVVFGINNASLSTLVTLTILAILLENQQKWAKPPTLEGARKQFGLLLIFALLAIFALSLRSVLGRPFAASSAIIGIFACLIWACFPRISQRWRLPFWAEIVPLLFIGVLLHRSHILEAAIVLSVPVVFGCIRDRSAAMVFRWTAFGFFLLVIGGLFGVIENKFFLGVIGVLTGKVINVEGSLDMSGGPRNALIEWIRVFPIVTSAILSGAFLSRFLSKKTRPLEVVDAAVVIGVLVIGISLFGLPFAYRTGFLVQFFFFLFFFKYLKELDLVSRLRPLARHRWIFLGVVVCACVAYGILGMNHYLKSFAAYSAVAALAVPLLTWLFHSRIGKRALGQGSYLALGCIALFFFEQRWMIIRFYDYSFGPWDERQSKVYISHFSQAELQDLLDFPLEPKGFDVFFSDPVTLANLKSIRGAPSFYLFPNIADVAPNVRESAIALMRDLFSGNTEKSDSAKVFEFARRVAPVSTLIPILERYPDAKLIYGSKESFRGPVGDPDDEVRLHVLVNARTAKWMDCSGDPECLGYFAHGFFEHPLKPESWPGASCVDQLCHQRLKTVVLSRRELIELSCRCTVDDQPKSTI